MEEKIEALKTADEYIDDIKSGIENLVNKINSGEENNGMLLIPQVADGVDWLINIIRLTSDLHKGSISIGDMNEKLEEIIEALENEDYVLIGDLFNYEFLPIIENIQDDIRKIILN
jgi:hypothetical protein